MPGRGTPTVAAATNLSGELDHLDQGRLPTTRPLDQPMPWVDPRDIAEVATARLLARDWTGRQVQAVHGPADLTWLEVAATLSKVLGRPIEAQHVTQDEERATLHEAGLDDGTIEGILGMSADFTPEQPRSLLTTTPGTLAAWAIDHL